MVLGDSPDLANVGGAQGSQCPGAEADRIYFMLPSRVALAGNRAVSTALASYSPGHPGPDCLGDHVVDTLGVVLDAPRVQQRLVLASPHIPGSLHDIFDSDT